MKKNNKELYIVNLSDKIAKKFNVHVYRALSPDLYTIYFSDNTKYIFEKRLLDFNLKTSKNKNLTINKEHHPFL